MIFFNSQPRPFSTLQLLIGLLSFFAILYVGFYITKWVLVFLSFIAPVLLIAALVMHYPTLKNFIQFLWQTIKQQPLFGIGLTVLAIVAFPITSLILFFRARKRWRLKRSMNSSETFDDSEYIDFVELPQEDEDNVKSLKNYR